MISLRPRVADTYLHRSRLLDQLPLEAGFTVWLEAPYGFGKSVLASQWAALLEQNGWRVLWLSVLGESLEKALAQSLDLPDYAPWSVILETLNQEQSLLVLEDLAGTEDLAALLQSFEGSVLLASRKHLTHPDLPKLATTGRLIHLTTSDLAFTVAEARQLFIDQDKAKAIWQRTNGWPLPLHYAALTGHEADAETLLEGIKQTVDEAAWRELCFLGAIPFLPKDYANAATVSLSKAGFVQPLEEGYRLPPFIADLLTQDKPLMRQAVLAEVNRLPMKMRGEAFETVQLYNKLTPLLENKSLRLAINSPNTFLRWHRLAPAPISETRHCHFVNALLMTNQTAKALNHVDILVEDQTVSVDAKLHVVGLAVFHLSERKQLAKAEQYYQRSEALFEAATSFQQGFFMHNTAHYFYQQAKLQNAQESYEKALEFYALVPDHPQREQFELRTYMNLQGLKLEYLRQEVGDISGAIQLLRDLLKKPISTYAFLQINYVLATCFIMLNDKALAEKHLGEVLAKTDTQFLIQANCLLAFLKQDVSPFPSLMQKAISWHLPDELLDGISALWLRTLRINNDYETPQQLESIMHQGPFTRLELCYQLHHRGKVEEALTELDMLSATEVNLDYKLQHLTARYLISRDEQFLNRLLNSSLERDRLFQYLLISLEALPRHRPELAQNYPLKDVLSSNWGEAIGDRIADIPPLQLKVLGTFEAFVLGEKVNLTERQKQILMLMLVGVNREVMAEAMWPEGDKKKVRNNLYVQLNLLRKVLEPWGKSTYLFDDGLAKTQADLFDLRAAIAQSDTERVLQLFRYPLAPGVDLPLLDEIRETLKNEVVSLLFTKSGTRKSLEAILKLDPLNEEALQQLMKQLIHRGRRLEARQHYKRFADLLKKEMQLEPLEETRRLLNLT